MVFIYLYINFRPGLGTFPAFPGLATLPGPCLARKTARSSFRRPPGRSYCLDRASDDLPGRPYCPDRPSNDLPGRSYCPNRPSDDLLGRSYRPDRPSDGLASRSYCLDRPSDDFVGRFNFWLDLRTTFQANTDRISIEIVDRIC